MTRAKSSLAGGRCMERVLNETSQPLGDRTSAGERSKRAEIMVRGECRRRKIVFSGESKRLSRVVKS
jgi:hypothetical protein